MKTCEESGLNDVCDEILNCLVSHSNVIAGEDTGQRMDSARAYLEEMFRLAGADYGKLNPAGIARVLKLLAAREMRKGGDTVSITEHIKHIARML